MKISQTILLLALCLQAACTARSQAFQKVIDGFDSPESTCGDGNYIYVSNVGKQLLPTVKDGDGYISRLSPDGEMLDKHFLPAGAFLHAPKGLLVLDGALFVADIDRLLGFDLQSRKQVFNMDFSSTGTSFLNALAAGEDNTLFISATDIGKIFLVDIEKKHFTPLDLPEVKGANGLCFDKSSQKLYVVGFGKDNQPNGELGVLEQQQGKYSYKAVRGITGYLDGIVKDRDGDMLISDWVDFNGKGEIWKIDHSQKYTAYPIPWEISGPADIWLDTNRRRLYIPAMPEGKLYIIQSD